jgi:hypothetical protein
MLTIYFGTDSMALRAELLKKVGAIDHATLVRFDETSIALPALEDTLGVKGLFEEQTVIVLDSVLEKMDVKEGVMQLLRNMHQSQNQYFLLAGDVLAADKKAFEKSGARLVERVGAKKSTGFNNASFALADAVGRRDKKTAWVLYRKAVMSGASPQEICGTLIWQMRLVVLSYVATTASDAGVSDFPFKKAVAFKRYHTEHEARRLLTYFLGIYHFDPDINTGNTELALEKILLTL